MALGCQPAQTYQVDVHFVAIIEGILMTPLKTIERFFCTLTFPAGLWDISILIGLVFQWILFIWSLRSNSRCSDDPLFVQVSVMKKQQHLVKWRQRTSKCDNLKATIYPTQKRLYGFMEWYLHSSSAFNHAGRGFLSFVHQRIKDNEYLNNTST